LIVLQQIISGIALGGLYALIALSFTLVIGVLNFLNFSIPGIFMLSGMMCWALMAVYGLNWFVSAIVAILIAIAASLLVERFTYRFMRTRFGDATEHAIPLVSSIGFLILFGGVIAIVYGGSIQQVSSPWPDPNLRIAGLIISIPNLASLLVALGSVIGLSWVLRHTDLGRGLRAIAENPETAEMLGINVGRIVPAVFVMTGAFTGLAGVLFTFNYLQVSPAMGDDIAPAGIAAMVIGGLGNVWGAVAGGVLVGLLEVLSTYFIGAKFIKIVVWGVLLAILLIRPQGLFGDRAIGKGKF
jgi:branched-chain amino acid transport system permease protein